MKLSKITYDILKNFASINNNILIQPGDQLKTVNNAEIKLIFAFASVPDTFDKTIGLYDLNEFLSVIDLLGGVSEVDFEFEDKCVLLTSETTKSSVKYWYAAPSTLSYPEKSIKMPTPQVIFEITGSVLSQLRRAASTFGHPMLSIFNTDSAIYAKTFDPDVSSGNTFEMVLYPLDFPLSNNFDFKFNIQNIKSLSFNPSEIVQVNFATLGKGKISQFIGENVTYYVSVDSNSTMNLNENE